MKKIKLFTFIALIIILLAGFAYLQTYDVPIEIKMGQYIITLRLVFLLLLVLAAQLVLGVVYYLISLPSGLIKKAILQAKQKREKKNLNQILITCKDISLGKPIDANKVLSGFLDHDLTEEMEKLVRTMFLKLDASFNVKLYYLQKLIENEPNDSGDRFYIAKALSAAALKEEAYHYSLEFAKVAFRINNKDPELLKLMIDIYASLESWNKMEEVIRSLINIDKSVLTNLKCKIGDYYLKAAKQFIGLGQAEDSTYYLKKCIEYNPSCSSCVKLMVQINIDDQDVPLKDIIEKAFAIKPTFDLFKLYCQRYKDILSPEEIYSNLISDISKKDHEPLIISMAYLLNIKSELDQNVLPVI